MTTRQYAQDTAVPVARTQEQLKALARSVKADQLAIYESAGNQSIMFGVDGRYYKLHAPIDPKAKNKAQDERRAWRLLHLLVKAKVEAIKCGATTVEREFYADTVMPNGQPLIEWFDPALREAYAVGKMPTQLLIGN